MTSTKNTPKEFTWEILYYDGQQTTLKIPVIRLADFSVDDIIERDLLHLGQFYPEKYTKITKKNVEAVRNDVEMLIEALKSAVDEKRVPMDAALQMQNIIRWNVDRIIQKSGEEVGEIMTTSIVETLPWIDYSEIFENLKDEGKAEGKAEGIAEGETKGIFKSQMEIAVKAFENMGANDNTGAILRSFGVPEEIIEAAKNQIESIGV